VECFQHKGYSYTIHAPQLTHTFLIRCSTVTADRGKYKAKYKHALSKLFQPLYLQVRPQEDLDRIAGAKKSCERERAFE
jgi:hypothetical protein